MTLRTVFAGADKIRLPATWTAFVWHGRTYRLHNGRVEVYDRIRQAWLPSIRVTTSAPLGRRVA